MRGIWSHSARNCLNKCRLLQKLFFSTSISLVTSSSRLPLCHRCNHCYLSFGWRLLSILADWSLHQNHRIIDTFFHAQDKKVRSRFGEKLQGVVAIFHCQSAVFCIINHSNVCWASLGISTVFLSMISYVCSLKWWDRRAA